MRIVRSTLAAAAAALFLLVVPGVPTPAQDAAPAFTAAQIEQMVSPIALYPDSLLSQVLMASTYPLEIVEADRWVKANASLKGSALDDALGKKTWDPSVISLCKLPDVLSQMSKNLDWTQDLGDAFLGQQADVMKAVQKLRDEAYKAGNLKTTEQQKVVVEKETIIIQPANPQVIYVPAYDPAVVYGVPPPPSYYYPAMMVPPPGYALARGIMWGAGFAIGNAMFGGCDWHGNNVYVNNVTINNNNIYKNTNVNNVNRSNVNNKQSWNHDTQHRGNVNYGNQQLNQKYKQGSQGGLNKDAARGYDRPGQGAGGQNRAGQPSAGTRDMNRSAQGGAGKADRATTGQKQSSFGGYGNGGFEQKASDRGAQSRNKPDSGMSRSSGGSGRGASSSSAKSGGRKR